MSHQLYACLGSGNCYKPWLLAQQLGLPLETKLIDVLAGEQKGPDFLAVNPLGVVPYLQTPNGLGIGESNAMLWYLAEGSTMIPATPGERAQALQWMFFEQSKLEPFISPARFFTTILPQMRDEKSAEIEAWQNGAALGLGVLDGHLEGRKFMVGENYSITDIAVYGYVHVMEEAGLTFADYPAIASWMTNVAATPGYAPLQDLGTGLRQAA